MADISRFGGDFSFLRSGYLRLMGMFYYLPAANRQPAVLAPEIVRDQLSVECTRMIEIVFSGCTVRIFPESRYLETVFPDGRTVPAAPQDNDDYRRIAREHGYGEDTFRLCLHHELLHTMLSEAAGKSCSPTLRAVAEGREGDRQEEETVMRFQKRLMEVSRIPGW